MPALDHQPRRDPHSLAELTRQAARALAAAGIEEPAREARVLVRTATGLDAASLLARPDAVADPQARQRLDALVARRSAHEPVSRIVGEREFYGRNFSLSPATLDPRPDSETVIEMALALAHERGWEARPLRILDVGTGTGCLLVTLLAELPLSAGMGTDVSAQALQTAAANARRHGVHERARFAEHDALDGIVETFDLMVCNPPYVADHEMAELAPEVRCYDPVRALAGGTDGLDVYRRLIPHLARVVAGGLAVFEVGAGQAPAVAKLLRRHVPQADGKGPVFREDLSGHTRCVATEIQL
jgi:release factor glutamine methyltransferase